MIEQSAKRGGNSLGIKPSDAPLVVVLLYASWDDAKDDEKAYGTTLEAIGAIDEEAARKNVASPYRYLNYAVKEQDPFSSYGPESKAHLLAVSRKFDPDGLFQTVGASPFKLGRVEPTV
jgi:hypothetical protein